MTSQLTASKPLPATKPVTLATAVDGTQQPVGQPAVAIKADLNPLPSKRPAKIAKNSQKQTFPDDEKTLDGNKLVEGEELVQGGVAAALTSLHADSGAAADLGVPAQGAAMNAPSAFASGISSESMLIAQLELPTIPSQSISSGVSASGAAASSSFGSLAGIFGAAAGGGLALGGGGGGRSAGPLPLPELDGRLVNGYIAGARVFQDLDGDGVFDSNEPNALTNEDGGFTLVGATQNGGSLIAMPTDDTIDQSTGLPVTSWFKAPADAAVISPLSTLVEAGLSEEELKAAFGIDGSVSILDFDPVEAVKGAGSVDAANLALKIKSANVVVSNLMDIGSSLAEGAGASSNSSDVSDMFVSSLVSTIKSNPSSEMNFEDAGLIFDIFDGALDGLGIDADLSEVTTAASARLAESAVALNANATVTDLNDAISKLTSISKIEKVIQDTVAVFVKNAVTNPSSLQELKDVDIEEEVRQVQLPESELTAVTVSFDKGDTSGYTLGKPADIDYDFGGAGSSIAEAPPAGASGAVAQVVKGVGAETWAGTTFLSLPAGELITPEAQIVTMRVWSPDAGTVVRLKLENASDNTKTVETEAKTTEAGAWQTLTFDFRNEATGTAELNHEYTFNKASVFFDFGTKGSGKTFYFDDVKFLDTVVVTEPEPDSGTAPETAPTAVKVTFDKGDTSGYTLGKPADIDYDFGGAGSSIAEAPPAGASGAVAQVVKGVGAETWAGTTFLSLPAGELITPEAQIVTMRVWSPDAGTKVLLKLETLDNPPGGPNFAEVLVTTSAANQWQTLSFDFTGANHTLSLAKASVFFDFGTKGSGKTFYFDDVKFLNAVSEASTEQILKVPDNYELSWSDEFGKAVTSVTSTEPAAGPAAPTADELDVVSLFSNTYTAATTAKWSTVWDQVDEVAEVGLSGNVALKYTNVGYIGIEPTETIDASAMNTFNISVWRTDATADLKIKLVDFQNGTWGPNNVEHEINLAASGGSAVAAGEWVDLTLNLSDFKDLTRTDHIGQIIISSHKYDDNGDPVASGETLYVDNMYFGAAATVTLTEPAAGPTAPTADELDVVSLFSNTYTAATTANWSTVWDQVDEVAEVDLSGNVALKYTNVGYIGIEPTETIDASAMNTFNISVWRTDATADLKIKLVDFQNGTWGPNNVEHEINLAASGGSAVAAGEWVDLTLNLSDFKDLTRTDHIGQIIISSHKYDDNGDPVASGETLYVDNMYFGAAATVTLTEPAAGPTAPTADELDVVSLFSNTYTAATTANWSTVWDQVDEVAEVDLSGNVALKYTNVGYIGIEPTETIDASAMNTFNISVWRTDATADLKIKLVDFQNGTWGPNNVEHEINLAASGGSAVAAGEWVDLTLNLSDFKDLTRTDHIGQIIISSHKYDDNGDPVASGETLYVDNMYFGAAATVTLTEPAAGPTAPTADELDVVSLFSNTYTAATTANWSTVWDQVDEVAEVDLSGNVALKYTNVGYIGIEPTETIDASAMNTFNISVWRTDATADLKIKLVDFQNGTWGPNNVEHEINLAASGGSAVAAGEWVDLTLNLSDFKDLTRTDHIGQIIISSHKYDDNGDPVASGETLYVDNMYFGAAAKAINPLIWEAQTGTGVGGWGNNESQTYTNSLTNAYVQNGALHIVAEQTSDGITSARLKSIPDVGPNSYVEVRAKVPVGEGSWPAIWLLGQDKWPDSGEIDIMEWSSKYFEPNETQAAIHTLDSYGDTENKGGVLLDTDVTEFQTYQALWTNDRIQFGVNGHVYYTYDKPANSSPENWPFTDPMDMILNLAIGGTLGGDVPSNDFNYEMVVDYVRVYQLDPDPSLLGV